MHLVGFILQFDEHPVCLVSQIPTSHETSNLQRKQFQQPAFMFNFRS